MRILIVSQSAPYLPCHDPVRNAPAQLLAQLAADHEIRLIAMTSPGETLAQRRWPTEHCLSLQLVAADRWRSPLTGAPERGLDAVRAAVEQAIGQFHPDLLHLEGPLLAPLARTCDLPTVMAVHDSRALRARDARHFAGGLGAWLKATIDERMETAWERRWFPGVDIAVVPSEDDRREVARHIPFSRVKVIPAGIDLEHYAFRRSSEADRLVFTGSLTWRSNVDTVQRLATRILPAIRKSRPRAELVVVGADPAGAARALVGTPGVRIVGTVSDIRPSIWGATVSVSALAAGVGAKNRVLETMALGTPVVGRAESFAGLPDVLPGHHAMMADSDEGVIDAVLLLLDEPVGARTLARNARTLVEQHHTWMAVARQYGALYARAGASRAETAVATAA